MANQPQRTDRSKPMEGVDYAGYTVRDRDGGRIGKVDNLFLDEDDRPEYVGVKMGFFGTRSTLIPLDACTVDKDRGFIEVNHPKHTVKDAPDFDDDGRITPDYKCRVREYYGLSKMDGSESRDVYDSYYADEERQDSECEDAENSSGKVGSGMHEGDVQGVNQPDGSGLKDELRVQRSEENLRAGIREREAGQVNVRKRVRTEREQIAVSERREEVSVDRIPANEFASQGQMGEGEVSVPVVEEDVRKEEVDTDDASGLRNR